MCRSVVIFLLLGILCPSALAEKNFWGNDICHSDRDCSGLTTCDFTFGCTVSVWKVALVVVGVFIGVVLLIIGCVWLCIRNLCNNRIRRPNNQYVPPTVITTNTTAWTQQQQMGAAATTTPYTYPYAPNPNPNQFYANPDNPPPYNPYVTDDRVGAPGMNASQMPNQMPSAPYSPTTYDGYAQPSQTYQAKY